MTKHHLPLQDRLMLYAKPAGECWLWEGTRTKFGYGTITLRRGGRVQTGVKVHRLAYELAFGSIPPGAHVLHRCDVRNCINPAHLFLGSNADNVRDKVAKGRQSKGVGTGRAKLTEDHVRAIRRACGSVISIAKQFGVGRNQIYAIRDGRSWRHLL